jgi:hypothetical protein
MEELWSARGWKEGGTKPEGWGQLGIDLPASAFLRGRNRWLHLTVTLWEQSCPLLHTESTVASPALRETWCST